MSPSDTRAPRASDGPLPDGVALVVDARRRDIGGFAVRRLLPFSKRRTVGPFIYLDEMGPAELPPGEGLDVKPHPHIGLATVTYLFEGEIVHRDSLGSLQPIRPGAVNWMTAGRGVVHSERSGPEERARASRLHGLQVWVALPEAAEEAAPDFHHHRADQLPELEIGGVRMRLLVGSAWGAVSPVRAASSLFYVDAALDDRASLELPAEHEERAAYVVAGAVRFGSALFAAGQMLVFAPGARPILRAEGATRLALFGGAPLDGPRHISWNFVSSSRARIETARLDWKEGRFPKVPGDEEEFVPLPE